MKSLLWVGDSPDCQSGFGKATREILAVLYPHYQINVLGLNYRGDPHPTIPYDVWVAAAGGDGFGVGRLVWMCDTVHPDVIVIQQDGWNIPLYIQKLRQFAEYKDTPVIAIVAVDGKNFRGAWLDGVQHAVFWTQFALDEARIGGYEGTANVIPLGVDLDIYRPLDRRTCRLKHMNPDLVDAFVVGNVNRNQPRKRWDLTIRYFAEWVKAKKYDDAWLCLHVAPTGDTGIDAIQLAGYYGIANRLMLHEPAVWYGVNEPTLAELYNCFDVQLTTTQGEGFGLTTIEGMACGIPQIVPDWSGLGEWTKDAAWLVPCVSTALNPISPGLNVIGGVPDQGHCLAALNRMYSDKWARTENRRCALARVSEPRFRWAEIGQRYLSVLEQVLAAPKAEPEAVEATA